MAIHNELRPSLVEPRRLEQLLFHTHSIISGSVLLAVLIPLKLWDWHPLNLDIYSVNKAVPQILDYLIE